TKSTVRNPLQVRMEKSPGRGRTVPECGLLEAEGVAREHVAGCRQTLRGVDVEPARRADEAIDRLAGPEQARVCLPDHAERHSRLHPREDLGLEDVETGKHE